MNLFTRYSPYYHPLKYLLFLLKHHVYGPLTCAPQTVITQVIDTDWTPQGRAYNIPYYCEFKTRHFHIFANWIRASLIFELMFPTHQSHKNFIFLEENETSLKQQHILRTAKCVCLQNYFPRNPHFKRGVRLKFEVIRYVAYYGIWRERLCVCGLWDKPTLLFCSVAAAVVSFVNRCYDVIRDGATYS